ncbi:MAG: SLC13 family permease [Thermodesulfobacteriota bacterium]
MPIDIIIVFALVILALILFASEILSFDVVALTIMTILMLTGILTTEEGLSGFSNPATITIGAMFVVSEGIRRTGALEIVGNCFSALGNLNYWFALALMMLIIAVVSAFINNTAAVVIFIPVIMSTAREMGVSPSKLLMPLSFASMFGGVCTLIGTSTNILVSSIAKDNGLEGFGMFEFTPLGLIFLAAGFAFLFTVGLRLIPARRKDENLTDSFEMKEYLADITLEEAFDGEGKTPDEIVRDWDVDVDVLRVFRKGKAPGTQRCQTALEVGDVLHVRGNPRELDKLIRTEAISLNPPREWGDRHLTEEDYALVEGVISPDSELASKTIGEINFPERFGAIVLGIRHRGELQHEKLEKIQLAGGDSLLLTVGYDQLPNLRNDPSFVFVSDLSVTDYQKNKMPLAIAILVGVVGGASLNLAPIVVTAAAGAILLIITGCVTSRQAYQAISWKVLFLLAGVIPLGTAMSKTGAARMLSDFILESLGQWGPQAVLSGFFLLTMLLTCMISNQATAAMLAPIAIQAGGQMEVNPEPFLMGITFAASLSFMTPMGYQTNTLIYGPGQYKFTDFTKVGGWLNLIFWIIATMMIPIIWTF